MLAGAIAGLIVGLLLVQFGPGETFYAVGDVTAALLLVTVPVGVVVGAVAALLMDRRSLKRSRPVD